MAKRLKRTFPSREAAISHMYAGGTSSEDLGHYLKGIHQPSIGAAIDSMIQKKRIRIK